MTANTPANPVTASGELSAARLTLDHLLLEADRMMREFISAQQARWSAVGPWGGVLIDALSTLLGAGGKRLRPAFCLSGYLAAGGDADDSRVIAAAAGLELLHAFALIHDDVIDESPLRRGLPTVHAWHAAEHRRREWLGDPCRYGESVAILAGDLALVYADQFMAGTPANVQSAWGELRSELIIGQYWDVVAAAELAVDPETARWIAILKSGRYTVHRPLVLGASLAGRPDLSQAFEAYGEAVGEAFQLRDDLLNTCGDAAVTGKPGGLDIEQHKMTLLLSLAMKRAPGLGDVVCGEGADRAALHALLAGADVRHDAEERIARLVEQGCQAIAHAAIEPDWRSELAVMARQVAYRDK